MGAPGLDFETWDPSRKCRQTYLDSSAYGLVSPNNSIHHHNSCSQWSLVPRSVMESAVPEGTTKEP